jgi:hypothetical protein
MSLEGRVTMRVSSTGIIMSLDPADHPLSAFVSIEGFARQDQEYDPHGQQRPPIEFTDATENGVDVRGTNPVLYRGGPYLFADDILVVEVEPASDPSA